MSSSPTGLRRGGLNKLTRERPISYITDKCTIALRMMMPAPRHTVQRMRGGYLMALQPKADSHERNLYAARTYEPATLALFDMVLRPGDNVIDVGANLGLMSLHGACRVGPTGKVFALEPHPIYYPRLVQNIRANHLNNICALQIAAGAISEERVIYDVPSVNIGRSSLIRPEVESRPAGIVSVQTLDRILYDIQESPIRLLKIDVEGFESEVLKGASRLLRRQPIVCMELTSALPHGADGPLAAHDILMSTQMYESFNFLYGKGVQSPLVKIVDRNRLEGQMHDNIIYIPKSIKNSLPRNLFINDGA